ncbi:glycosyltransferase family 9 protein [Bowmanella denitrificans]|uniref:glycosyltransferase family 9 protein n=1 Tax=Bowmanella denitrificans TaxID=366582 RepID=UPI000C9C2544|nr:hypothetical protein [Bowmanella denitrificans]
MTIPSPKVLLVPVSSPEGIGEYMRCLILAKAIMAEMPNATIRFILSKHAPYAASCPYPALLLDASPTKCEAEVCQEIATFKPDLVIFDASGRQSQLAQAKNMGAKVVFISQHRSKRRRGMRISRAKYTDRHWVVQPEFVIGAPNWFDRQKLRLLGFTQPYCIGPVFTPPAEERQQRLLAEYGLQKRQFLLLNAGSGGHKGPDGLAADSFAQSAKALADHGNQVVMVFGPNYPKPIPDIANIICLNAVDNDDFINLLAASRYAVLSGGDTLLQAIALGVPTVAVAVSKDQPKRISACLKQGLIMISPCQTDSITQVALQMEQPRSMEKIKRNLSKFQGLNGVDTAMQDIRQLLKDLQNE